MPPPAMITALSVTHSPQSPRTLSIEPCPDPLDRLAHFRGRTGIAEADEVAAVNRIEIDAGRRRDTGLVEHAFCKIEAVVGEARDIGVEIEGAVDRQELVEAGARQAFGQDAAVLIV